MLIAGINHFDDAIEVTAAAARSADELAPLRPIKI
jgi:hypothetical protein